MLIILPIFTLLFALIIGAPIYMCLLAAGVVYFAMNPNLGTFVIPQLMNAGLMKYTFLAIPFFIMSGICMNSTGITRRLMKFSEVVAGKLPGGLAHVNIILSTLMGGLSGSNIADAASDCKMLVPEMEKRGFSRAYSAAVTAASSLITPIIPPGIGMVLYAFIANVSVGKMFLAGIVPGILMMVWEMVANHFVSKRRGYVPARDTWATPREILREGRSAFLSFLFPVIIIVGIRMGVFTPTEAGAVAVAYSLLLGTLLFRETKLKDIWQALIDTALSTCTSLMIFASANVFSYFVTNEKLSDMLAAFVLSFATTPITFLLVFIVLVLIMGMFLDGTTMMIILVPLFLPTATQLGIDPIYFGIIFLLCSAVGNITPPVGVVMYTVCDLIDVKVKDFTIESMPFYLVLVLNLLLMVIFPQIIMFLPNLLF